MDPFFTTDIAHDKDVIMRGRYHLGMISLFQLSVLSWFRIR